MTISRGVVAAGILLAAGIGLVSFTETRIGRNEVNRLAEMLTLHEGMTVAEVGAGRGWLSVEVAKRVGTSGHLYATDLDPTRLEDIRKAVRGASLVNVTVLQAGERSTNLPEGCCEAVFMRRVYHHLSDPFAVTASIHDALKPGGRLVIIEFKPDGVVGLVTRMGLDRAVVVERVSAVGFRAVRVEAWPGWDHYVAMFEKPAGPGAAATSSHVTR